MKKLFSILVCFVIAFVLVMANVQTADASSVRMNSLGMDPSTYWMIQKDTQTINYVNPAALTLFPQLIWFAWTPTTNGVGGINVKPTNELSVYVLTGAAPASELNSNMFQDTTMDSAVDLDPGPGFDYVYNPDAWQASSGPALSTRQISAIIGYVMGDMKLGFDVGYSATKDKETAKDAAGTNDESSDYNRSETYVRVGVNKDLGNGQDVDVTGSYAMLGVNNVDKEKVSGYESSYKSDGAMIASILGRYNMNLDEKSRLHAYGQLRYLNLSAKAKDNSAALNTMTLGTVDAAEIAYGRTGYDLTLGASNELKVNETALLFYGAMIKYAVLNKDYSFKLDGVKSENVKVDTTTITVPVVIGVEANITEGWKARFGANYMIYNSYKEEVTDKDVASGAKDKEGEENLNDGAGSASVGAAYKLGNFLFEWNMQKSLFTTGPNVIGGGAPGMASAFIVTYFF